MNTIFRKAILLVILCLAFLSGFSLLNDPEETRSLPKPEIREITGRIKKGETLTDLFKKHHLDFSELYRIREASANIHHLRELHPGRPYKIVLSQNEQIDSFSYGMDDDWLLNVNRTDGGYAAEKVALAYERQLLHIGGTIKDNLIASLDRSHNSLLLALTLSDIFAWEIDFSTDLRNSDSFKIVVEGLYSGGRFIKYGDILAAEFMNNGTVYRAYAFRQNGKTDYYDETGKSLRKPFLKSPLSFRRISSGFSRGRVHPILKIYRPHQGIDYAAATGTPVSASGDGTVIFAGRRGQYGNLIVIRHRNGYKTYYGHLSRIGRGMKSGAEVDQGKVIGYVGATGLATGPHLHYEMRLHDRQVNPLSLKIPRGTVIADAALPPFKQFTNRMDSELASIHPSPPAAAGRAAIGRDGKEG
ncbi:MAG: peptidoglycan DD-metalloendopeptidase family protein [Deltaproteobacteria bacterium]|nr:peptidoglycan DD-metalloendopeptidase family protein [Deltaproteobacteria bacterium]